MAQENADPSAQNQGEEDPHFFPDALENSRICVAVSSPTSFDIIDWSLNDLHNAIACQVKVVIDFRRTVGDLLEIFKLAKGVLDQTTCDSARWELGHSPVGKVHWCRMLWGLRNEQKLGSDNKIVCQDFGDKIIWDMPRLSKLGISMNSKHFLEQQRTSNTQFALMLLNHMQKRGQNCSPSLQTETNLWKKLNILSSVNHFSLQNEESSVAIAIDLIDAKMTSQKLEYSSDCNLKRHKETMPKNPTLQPHDDTFNQQKCKETAQRVSASVFFAIVCIWFLLATRSYVSSVATLIHVQPLHEEHGPVSIGVPLIGLFGFMAFVWAVAMMILAGAHFTRLHSAVFIFWAILMHVKPSAFQY